MIPQKGINVDGKPCDMPQITVETPYMDFTASWRTRGPNLEPYVWAQIETAPASIVAFLHRPEPDPSIPTILLMQKQRPETGMTIIKLPGGYDCHARNGDPAEKVWMDTGIRVVNGLNDLGQMRGHAVIRTPIRFYWTLDWRQDSEPLPGITMLEVSLPEAAMMAVRQELDDDASTELVLMMYCLWSEGKIAVI